jgi:hypothetical protein
MASYDEQISGHTVTVTYLQGGTNQVGVKKSSKVKAWALCPISGKRIECASQSVGEATRAVVTAVEESIKTESEATEPAIA